MSILLVVTIFLKKRILSVLLCLESFVILRVLLLVNHSELMFRVCFISIGACERAIGLACLVGLVRNQGSALSAL